MKPNNAPILEIRNATKTYGDFQAVTSVNLSIYEGEFITLLGPSGSGKTTILQMIAGFVQPTEGEILLREKNILNTPSHKRNMGFVFQDYALFPHMNVFQNIAYPLKIRKWDKKKIEEAVNETMNLVQLQEFGHRKPNELSGGQQQRVALARALVFKPDLILMDEPLGALDKKLREYFQLEIKKIQSITGVTIIFVTHDQEEALVMSDRIAVMNRSKMVQLGNAEELYENPIDYFVADFIGQNNFIKGYIFEDEDEKQKVKLLQGTVIDLDPSVATTDNSEGRVYLSIRPENIRLLDMVEETKNNKNVTLKGQIKNKVYLGNSYKYIVEIEEMDESVHLTTIKSNEQEWNTGEKVLVSFSWEALRVLNQ
ncbi:ABC transporter ATP-binding protein [Virgibacillus kimchii]